MTQLLMICADVVAFFVLAIGLYLRRYRRSSIVIAMTGLNVGVLAVSTALVSADVSVGFGFGLFGVLSIVRLRSAELEQEEVAYYFSALALGMLGGVTVTPVWLGPTLMAAIVGGLFLVDNPRIFGDNRHQTITLDRAYTNEAEMIARLENLLDGKVVRTRVKKVDLIVDSTVVDVRYKLQTS